MRLDAARMLMRATDSLLRRGNLLSPERWLVKELSEVTPGVTGPPCGTWGVLGERGSMSSGQRKARPRARGSTICQEQIRGAFGRRTGRTDTTAAGPRRDGRGQTVHAETLDPLLRL